MSIRQCKISEKLYQEIKYAQENLNSSEKAKVKGIKKKHWTFQEASDELGKYLNSKRKTKTTNIMNIFN